MIDFLTMINPTPCCVLLCLGPQISLGFSFALLNPQVIFNHVCFLEMWISNKCKFWPCLSYMLCHFQTFENVTSFLVHKKTFSTLVKVSLSIPQEEPELISVPDGSLRSSFLTFWWYKELEFDLDRLSRTFVDKLTEIPLWKAPATHLAEPTGITQKESYVLEFARALKSNFRVWEMSQQIYPW